MERFEMNGTRSLSLPFFLAGLGAGVALTLLLAPLSGEATRNLIGRKVKEGADWVKDTAAAAEDSVLAQTAGLKNRVKEVAEVITRS
jgi:gas vesicle protein